MKIAFVIERMKPSKGGAETWVYDFAASLAADDHDVHVLSRSGSTVPEKVTLHTVPVRGIGRAWRSLSFARNVARMLSREKFDVVHGVGKSWGADVYQPHGGVHLASFEANMKMHSAFARMFRPLAPKQSAFRRIERVQYVEKPARMFVALSEMVRRDMRRFYDVPDEKIRIVYNGVDIERFHPSRRAEHRSAFRDRFGIADDEVVFLVVAHNFRLKGVPQLVDVVTARDFPHCRLMVVGGGRPGPLEQRAEDRRVGRVIFTGPLGDPVPVYAAADVYVHPTFYDPCSLVVLEALASGLPVITSTMNGAGELMRDGREGYVIEPPWREDSIAKLAEGMRQMFDEDKRRNMAVRARALAEKHTIKHNYREMMDVYEAAIEEKRTR